MSQPRQPKDLLREALDHADCDLTPEAGDIMSCLLAGLIAALPAFLQAFMACMSGTPTGGSYNPGDRNRCG